jgi:hypothetical protein
MNARSILEREELRIFEELISRFDSLTEVQMSTVAVTPEWSAKDLLAHLAYWERAAAERVREFEAGRSSVKGLRAPRKSASAVRADTPLHGASGRCGYRRPLDGHDSASGITLDGNRKIWTWKLYLFFFQVSLSLSDAQPLRNCVTCSTNSSGYWYCAP